MKNISNSALMQLKSFGNVEKLSLGLANGVYDFAKISKNLPNEIRGKLDCDDNTTDFANKFVKDPFRIIYDNDVMTILPEMAPNLDTCSKYMLIFVYCYRLSLQQNRETKEFIRKDVLFRMEEFANLIKHKSGVPRTFTYGILYSNVDKQQ